MFKGETPSLASSAILEFRYDSFLSSVVQILDAQPPSRPSSRPFQQLCIKRPRTKTVSTLAFFHLAWRWAFPRLNDQFFNCINCFVEPKFCFDTLSSISA